MSARRKPRKDGSPRKIARTAKLLGLPASDRALVAGWMQADGLDSCLQRIATQLRIECSRTTLYEALAFWESEERRDRTRAQALSQLDGEAEEKSFTPQEKMAALDRRMAEIYAAKDEHANYQDARYLIIAHEAAKTRGELERLKLKLKSRQIAQKDEEIAMMREKLILAGCEKIMLAARDPKTREVVEDANLTNAQKIAHLRQTYFADIDALQASGKVVLPE